MKRSILILLLAQASPCAAQDIKLSTWNLNWFTLRSAEAAGLPADVRPRDTPDIARLRGYAEKLSADIVGLQEVDGADAASALFDKSLYQVAMIGEDVTQRVGIAVRKPIRIRDAQDYAALDVTPDAPFRLRDGLDVVLDLPDGQSLRVLVVHLKSGCFYAAFKDTRRASCQELARQIAPLADWIRARAAEHASFIVMGDFNRVFDRHEEMGEKLADAAPLTRVTAGYANPCWGGKPFIDHIFLGGAARQWLLQGSLRVQTFATKDADETWRLSDHCPVSVTLHPPAGGLATQDRNGPAESPRPNP